MKALELAKLEEEHQDVKICICFQNRYNETFEALQGNCGKRKIRQS